MLLLGSLCSWTLESCGLIGGSLFVIQFLSGSTLPLAFFPGVLGAVAAFRPFQGLINLPIVFCLGHIGGIAGWRAFAQHAYDFAAGTAYTLLYQLVGIGTIYVLPSRYHRLGGWPLPALLFLFALRLLSHGAYPLLLRPVKQVPTHIRQGTFNRFLPRPKPPLLQAWRSPTRNRATT